MFGRYLSLFLGVIACNTPAIQLKASHTHPIVLAAFRLLIAVIFLSPLFWVNWRRHRATYTAAHLRRCLAPAVVLAAHFITWAYGARMTLSAQASLIVNLAPVAIPFFLHHLVGERINRTEILGTALAVGGVLLLSMRDAFAGGGDVAGNAVCFGSMLLFAWYLALGRRNRDFPSLWLYVVPVYLIAGALCLVVALPWLGTLDVGSTREWSLIVGLACIPTIIGHSLLNDAMRHLRGQIVSLCNTTQFVFSGVMAFYIFDERPSVAFYLATVPVLAGIALVVFAAPTSPPRLR